MAKPPLPSSPLCQINWGVDKQGRERRGAATKLPTSLGGPSPSPRFGYSRRYERGGSGHTNKQQSSGRDGGAARHPTPPSSFGSRAAPPAPQTWNTLRGERGNPSRPRGRIAPSAGRTQRDTARRRGAASPGSNMAPLSGGPSMPPDSTEPQEIAAFSSWEPQAPSHPPRGSPASPHAMVAVSGFGLVQGFFLKPFHIRESSGLSPSPMVNAQGQAGAQAGWEQPPLLLRCAPCHGGTDSTAPAASRDARMHHCCQHVLQKPATATHPPPSRRPQRPANLSSCQRTHGPTTNNQELIEGG